MDSDLIKRIIYFKEEPIKGIDEERLDEVAYNPTTKHWYYDSYTFPVDYYPTKCGDIDPKSLTKRMKAKRFFGLNIEHFTSYDVLLFKDARDRIAVFTMVATQPLTWAVFGEPTIKDSGIKRFTFSLTPKAIIALGPITI